MSPRPLGTTVFEEIYIRTMGKQSYSSEINLRLVYSNFYDHVDHHICRSAFGLQEAPGVKKSKFFGMVRDALGGIGGSSLSIFTGFSKDFEKLKIRKLKIDQNRFKMC